MIPTSYNLSVENRSLADLTRALGAVRFSRGNGWFPLRPGEYPTSCLLALVTNSGMIFKDYSKGTQTVLLVTKMSNRAHAGNNDSAIRLTT